MEGLGRRIWSQAGSGKKLKSLSEKLTKAKSDWGCGSSGRAPALQVQGPKFKLSQRKKNNAKE
jgi:hypothetical protein